MLNIDATDKIEGIASVADKVEFTCSVVDGTDVKSSEGLLSDSQTQIYLAVATTRVLSLTLVNTHTSAVTVNVQKDPTDAGTLYRIIPKDLSLGIGYMLVFDGQQCTVLDASGNLLTSFANLISDAAYGAGWNGVTTIAPSKNAVYDKIETLAPIDDPTFTTKITTPTINLAGGQIAFPATAVPSADPNTMDDYEEGDVTVAMVCGTSGTITLSSNTLSYTKKGREVSICGYLLIDSVSSPVGSLTVTGLPFTSGNNAKFISGSGLYADVLETAAATAMVGYVAENSPAIVIRKFSAGSATDAAALVKANSRFLLSVVYFV